MRVRSSFSGEILRVEGWTAGYRPGAPVLSGVNFSLNKGEFVVLIGGSGCGKSTLFKSVLGLTPVHHGKLWLNGLTVSPYQLRHKVSFVYQSFNLVDNHTALANVLYGLLDRPPYFRKLLGLFPKEEVEKALRSVDVVGLAEKADMKVRALSGGEKQRVAVARALVRSPAVIFADEPVSNLDPPKARKVLKLFYDLVKTRGIAVLCSLHTPELALEYADRFLGVKSGKVVEVDAEEVPSFYV